jgi:hypothetical protein
MNTTGFVKVKTTLSGMADIILAKDWAPAEWIGEYRAIKNFVSAECIGIDVDMGETIERAAELCRGHPHIIATTKSHGKPKRSDPVCRDRYRVVLPLEQKILCPKVYKHNALLLARRFGGDNTQCTGASHFQPSIKIYSIQSIGSPIIARYPDPEPEVDRSQYRNLIGTGIIEGWAANTLRNYRNHGGRNSASYIAAKKLKDAGRDEHFAVEFIRGLTDLPEREIESVVKSAWRI